MESRKKAEFPVAIYGAGAVANSLYGILKKEYNVVCFCDSDKKKQGGVLLGKPVMSIEDAEKQYADLHVFVATQTEHKFAIMDALIKKGFPKEKILNYEPYKWYKSCSQLESRIGVAGEAMVICPSSFGKRKAPVIGYQGDVEKDIAKFIEVRDAIIEEVASDGTIKSEKAGSHNCIGCPNVREGFWAENRRISDVCFSIKHKCNFKCCYCVEAKLDKSELSGDEHLDEVLGMLASMREKNILDKKAIISVAPTEISVHPFKEKILDSTKNYVCQFTTNSAVYVEKIAESLENGGKIFCSLDSGTRETFKEVKGVDCFQRVCDNLKNYAKHGEVEVKYIFLPDVNDNEADVKGFVEAAEYIGATAIHIARNACEFNVGLSEHTLKMIILMINEARNKDIWVNCSPLVFNKEEYEYIQSRVNS